MEDVIIKTSVEINVSVRLEGELQIPKYAKGIVLFSHGSGSSRFSPRNNYVAQVLSDHQIGTLLFDLLTEEEDEYYDNRFDIDLLTDRLVEITEWVNRQEFGQGFTFGLFGSSTGAASALRASVILGDKVKAVVSRGGRPDLAKEILDQVKVPTLLIVGGNDFDVLQLNNAALNELKCEKKIDILPGATHLFSEQGMLEEVAEHAAGWFSKYL